jgi:hypothetical protein
MRILAEAIASALTDSELQKWLIEHDGDPLGMSHSEFARFVRREAGGGSADRRGRLKEQGQSDTPGPSSSKLGLMLADGTDAVDAPAGDRPMEPRAVQSPGATVSRLHRRQRAMGPVPVPAR